MSKARQLITFLFLSATAACTGEDAISSLVNTTAEPAGANCTTGGVRIDTGEDDNGNGTLEAAEIGSSKYVCNGTNGTNGTGGGGTGDKIVLT